MWPLHILLQGTLIEGEGLVQLPLKAVKKLYKFVLKYVAFTNSSRLFTQFFVDFTAKCTA
jgi:hypothetical protein